jgi:hypothetical protein
MTFYWDVLPPRPGFLCKDVKLKDLRYHMAQ